MHLKQRELYIIELINRIGYKILNNKEIYYSQKLKYKFTRRPFY